MTNTQKNKIYKLAYEKVKQDKKRRNYKASDIIKL